ncbi:hypothetical protein AAC387_Pa05g2276 [Persea americana]
MGIGTKRANIYFDVITAYEFDSLMAQGELYHDTATKVSGRASQGRHFVLSPTNIGTITPKWTVPIHQHMPQQRS